MANQVPAIDKHKWDLDLPRMSDLLRTFCHLNGIDEIEFISACPRLGPEYKPKQ